MAWEFELKLAVEAALEAGALLGELITKEKVVLSATDKDIKLQADRDAESIILEACAKSAYPVLAEESGEIGLTDEDTPFWVVDPLDGTLNFSRGLPICCVSIALCHGDKPLLGVIYDFNRGECYQAVTGEQALCNGEPIHVSDIRDRSQASIATGFPSYRDYSSESLQEFLGQVQQFKKVRMLGSAAMHMAYLARGCVDAYVEEDIMLWDVAAGMAIIEGAGGVVELTQSPNYKWGRIIRCASHEDIWA